MVDSIPAQLFMSAFLGFFFVAFVLYHLMVFKVNRFLDVGEKFPHSLSFGQRAKLRDLYKSLYPRSVVYQFTMICAGAMFLLALGFVAFRMWDFLRGTAHL